MTAPAVPERVRTVTYFILLGCSALVLLTVGLAPIWLAADTATKIVASGGVLTSVFGVIAGGLGVAYRPTAQHDVTTGATPTPTEP